MAGVGHLKRTWRDAFRLAGTIQATSSSKMLGGQGAAFLREVAFWSIKSSGLLKDFAWQVQIQVQHGAALRMTWPHFFAQVQCFRTFRQMEWKNHKTHWYEAVSCVLNFPFLKEFLQNCFVFEFVSFENWGILAELLRFWYCQLPNLKEISQKKKKQLPLSAFNCQISSKTRRISSLQEDR